MSLIKAEEACYQKGPSGPSQQLQERESSEDTLESQFTSHCNIGQKGYAHHKLLEATEGEDIRERVDKATMSDQLGLIPER